MSTPSPRADLVEAIDAYAEAKVSKNALLQKLATNHLAGILGRVDIVAPVDAPEEVKRFAKGLQSEEGA